MNHVDLGKAGEDRAVAFLESRNMTILDRNYRFMRAEVDIVAATDREIVFVEVKTRRSRTFGEPEESVDKKKKQQLFKVAEAWMHERRMEGAPVRFDVVTIMNPGRKGEEINHIEGAFWYV
ncbi:YraN family protein [Balneolales bacterium ANBcel1]|nr:YraN family protein [Balneolales bacterium ANBcel1]